MKHHISAIALLSISSALFAEETVNLQPENIQELPTTIVTGDLWESELQNTTASVTVLDEAALKSNGTQHFEDVINAIPNLTWTGGTSRPRYIQIRGIGENSQFEGETPDSSVRFLIDDLDLTGLGTVGNLFDVQQVEVLRGPQAGAFGANAAGGVIKIVTNEPTAYWTGQAEATVGSDSLRAGGIAIGGPLLQNDPEQLTFRFSAHQLEQDGFRENEFLDKDDTNERDELTTRLKVRWLANEDWQFDGSLFYADADNGYDEWSMDNTGFDTYSDELGRDEQESLGGAIHATWRGLNNVDITSVTSFTDTKSLISFDGDWTNLNRRPDQYEGFFSTDRDRLNWSQELRLDSTLKEDALGWIDRWTLGLYFESLEEDTLFASKYIEPGFASFEEFSTTYSSDNLSLFGQATHLFSDTTRLTVGLRAERFELETDIETREDVDFKDWLFGGRITLEHDLDHEKTLFASVTRGYKAGGANIFPGLKAGIPTSYDTETLWNYEIGLRADWFEGAVASQITVFYLDRDNAQFRDSGGENIDFGYSTNNGEGASHFGTEAEATWFINKNWSIKASIGLLRAERETYSLAGSSFSSRDLANAPEYTFSGRIDYVADNGFFSNLELAGSDSYYESNSHNEKRSAYHIVNGSIGYRFKQWTFTLWGKNLFDESYEKRIFFFENDLADGFSQKRRYENPAAPRTFGVTANYSW